MQASRIVMFLGVLFCADIGAAYAQQCERLPPAPGAGGYQLRRGSDRCEGIYISPVSGGGLQLVSLTFGRIAYEPDRDPTLFIQAPRTASAGLQLQGMGVPIGLYYRLDAALAEGRDFQLPLTAVIKPNQIVASDLGLLAYRDAGGGRRVFLPVQVATDPKKFQAPQASIAIIRPDSDIQNVRWRLTPAGNPAPGEFQPVASAQGPVPSGYRMEIALPGFAPANEAVLELRYLDLGGRERTSRFQLALR